MIQNPNFNIILRFVLFTLNNFTIESALDYHIQEILILTIVANLYIKLNDMALRTSAFLL